MAKYVVMIETDTNPDPGNCDRCEFRCPYHMTYWDKEWMREISSPARCLNLDDFYCPIRAIVDVETFMKWKQEHPGFGDPLQIEEKR